MSDAQAYADPDFRMELTPLAKRSGLAWLVNNDVQLSTAVFRGLNRSTPDWEWTVGLSLRF